MTLEEDIKHAKWHNIDNEKPPFCKRILVKLQNNSIEYGSIDTIGGEKKLLLCPSRFHVIFSPHLIRDIIDIKEWSFLTAISLF